MKEGLRYLTCCYSGGRCRRIALLFAVLFSLCSFAGAQNTFVAEGPGVVEQNEFFNIVFTANDEITEFERPTVTGAEILAGPTPSRMSSTTIINGKRTSRTEVSYTYVLRATQPGKVIVSAASAVIGSKRYSTAPLEIEVVESSQAANQGRNRQNSNSSSQESAGGVSPNGSISADDLFLGLSFSKTKVVKGEPIIATLKLYTRVPVAGFEDVRFPVFNGFWSNEIETPQNINFTRERYGNKIYDAAVLRRYLLLPQQTGNINVDPAEMICQVQVRGSGGNSFLDDFFDTYQTIKKRIVSKAATISVTPLPAGAPADFGGGVGSFKMKAGLSREEIKAHEASSLVVEISGMGNLNLIESPKVELPADFEKYDVKTENKFNNTASGISGSKRFEFPFIPRSQGEFAIPPISYSYYDISAGRYVTLTSDTIRVSVAKGEKSLSGGTIISGLNKQDVVNLESDIRYISMSKPHFMKRDAFFFGSLLFFALLLLLLIAAYLIYRMLAARERLRGDVKRVRNRKANKVAKNRLKLARSYMEQQLQTPFYEEVHKALLGYVSDKLSIQFADMQRETINETLLARGIGNDLIERLISLLDECEMARYSREIGESTPESLYNRAIEIISDFENKL